MNLAYQFITKLYIKHFITFLVGAEMFFLLIDFLQNQKHIPSSANQITLYIYFQAIAGLQITLPLALCFATISAFAILSKTSEGIALLSIGFSKKQIIIPMAITAFAIGIAHLIIMSTDASRSYDKAQGILQDQNKRLLDGNALMFKHDEKLITIEKINWVSAKAQGVKIFEFDDGKPIKMIQSDNAKYQNDVWILDNAIMVTIPKSSDLNSSAKPEIKNIGNIEALQGFWPKIMDNISNSQGNLSFLDMAKAIILLNNSKLNTDKLKTKFFNTLLTPLIVVCAVIMLGLTAPLNSRSASWIRQSAIPVFLTIVIWGCFIAMNKIMATMIYGLWPIIVAIVFTFFANRVWQRS